MFFLIINFFDLLRGTSQKKILSKLKTKKFDGSFWRRLCVLAFKFVFYTLYFFYRLHREALEDIRDRFLRYYDFVNLKRKFVDYNI
jgi:hypothetical protein